MWRRATLAIFILVITLPLAALAQETENIGPPPMIWAVPRIQLYSDGNRELFRGLDATLLLPLSPRTHVTTTYSWDREADSYTTATFNYDRSLSQDTILRGSIGFIRDDFGYGLTVHRSYPQYGVGAFAQSVDGDFEGGLMLTHKINWGIKLRHVSRDKRSESQDWTSGAGDVGDLGARAALAFRAGGKSDDLSTTTAYFPTVRHSWVREGRSAQGRSVTGAAFTPPARPSWRFKTEGPVRTSAAIVNGVAYVGSYDSWLYALDLALGRLLWRYPAESPITGAPAYAEGLLFFGTEGGEIVCVAPPERDGPPTGRRVWAYRTGAAITASPLVTDTGLVITGSCDGTVYALDRKGGKLVWRADLGAPVMASATKVARRIPSLVDMSGQPTTRSGGVLVGSSDGKLYALDEVRGQTIWSFTTDGPVTGAAAIEGNRVYVGNRAGTLNCLSAANGQQHWSARVNGSIASAPALDAQRVYVATNEGGVFTFDALSGAPLWQCDLRAPIVSSPTLVRGDVMYLTTRDGQLWALDRPSGRVLWNHQEREPLATAAAIADNHLLVGGDVSGLYAFVPGAGRLPAMTVAGLPTPTTTPTATVTPPVETPPTTPPATTPDIPVTTPTVPSRPVVVTPAPPGSVASLPPPPSAPATTPAQPGTPVKPAVPTTPAVPPTTGPDRPVAPTTPVTPTVPTAPTTPVAPTVPPTPTVPDKPTPPVAPTTPAQPGTTDFPPPTTSVKPPTPPTPTVPTTPAQPPTQPLAPPAGETTPALMTLLVSPADGRTPVLLCNQNYLFVGGKIAATADIANIRVNGIEAAIKNGEYMMQVTFPGPGDYEVVVEATDRSGQRATHRREVTVTGGIHAVAPRPLSLRQRSGSPIVTFAPGLRGVGPAGYQKTIEIRNEKDQLVHNWTMPATMVDEIAWNGANANGKPIPPGTYQLIYLIAGPDGPLASLRQTIELAP